MPHSARQCGPLRTLTSHSQPNMGFVCFRLTLNCKRQANRILVSSFRCKDQTSNRRSKSKDMLLPAEGGSRRGMRGIESFDRDWKGGKNMLPGKERLWFK